LSPFYLEKNLNLTMDAWASSAQAAMGLDILDSAAGCQQGRQQQAGASSARAARGLDGAVDDGRMGFFGASSAGPRQRCCRGA